MGGDAWAVQADVTDEQRVHGMVGEVLSEWGTLDVVVNNAFRPYPFDPEGRSTFQELGWSHYQDQLNGALKGVYHVTKSVLPHMEKRGAGRIINIITDLIARPVVPYHEYTTAKSAVLGFSRNLAAEVGAFGVTLSQHSALAI